MRQFTLSHLFALALAVTFSQSAYSENWVETFIKGVFSGKGGSSGGGGGGGGSKDAGKYAAAYVGGGAGSVTVKDPELGFRPKSNIYGLLGIEVSLFGSPLFIDIGAEGFLGSGELAYDYTGTDSVHYTDPAVKYITSSASFTAGLKLRIINAKYFRFYVEGGGTWGAQSLRFETTGTTLPSQGTKYLDSVSNVGIRGHFADAGIEIGSSQALRIGGRYHSLTSDAILPFNNTKTSFTDLIGYLGISAGL